MYVFLCTKNFQPKNKYAILSIIAQLLSVYVIITAFIYCSASVFCCIFSHSSSATTVTAAATAATTTTAAAATTTTTAKSRKTNFFVLFLFCYVSPLLSIRFVLLFSTAVIYVALILFFAAFTTVRQSSFLRFKIFFNILDLYLKHTNDEAAQSRDRHARARK